MDAPTQSRGDVTVKIGASVGTYTGKPASRPYELTVHTGTAPREVTVDGRKVSGWEYDNGVVRVKTRDLHRTLCCRPARWHLLGRRTGRGEHLRHAGAHTPSLWNAPGQATEVTATFHNGSKTTMRNVRLDVQAPTGWTVTGQNTFATVQPGQTVTTKLQVTPGTDVKPLRSLWS